MNKMPVVTIRGQLGSGAPDVGREVARLIQGDYVDREVIAAIAQKVGRTETNVEEKEQVPAGLGKRILSALEQALARSGSVDSAYLYTWEETLDDEKYLDALKSVIKELALQDNTVLVGRGSQFILSDNSSILNVLTICPVDIRIKRVMASSHVAENEARSQIEEYDGSRRAFIQRFFKRELENPLYYDLVINTGHLTYELGARLIVAAANEKTPWSHG
jgi:cytidylate kinase